MGYTSDDSYSTNYNGVCCCHGNNFPFTINSSISRLITRSLNVRELININHINSSETSSTVYYNHLIKCQYEIQNSVMYHI